MFDSTVSGNRGVFILFVGVSCFGALELYVDVVVALLIFVTTSSLLEKDRATCAMATSRPGFSVIGVFEVLTISTGSLFWIGRTRLRPATRPVAVVNLDRGEHIAKDGSGRDLLVDLNITMASD